MRKRMTITIGDKVKKARELAGLTQFELAVKSGVQQGTISRLERNIGEGSLTSLCRVADALGVSIDSLRNGSPVVETMAAKKAAESKTAKGKNA